jgi:superfamily I DNA/RNA helicase
MALLRPGRGGMMLAGDANQALYREAGAPRVGAHAIEHVHLKRSYRSTPQILRATAAMHPDVPGPQVDPDMDGQPVDLVWAHNAEQQAEAVARDVLLLIQGQRQPQDIGVLVTRKFQMGKIAAKLSEADVPVRVIYSNQADSLDLAEGAVKVMTVHSAKGLEFDVVFLVGIEHLPDPNGTEDNDRQGRTGLVGATRARDQLVLTYTKDNMYLERIRNLPPETLRRWVWPDDYPEA